MNAQHIDTLMDDSITDVVTKIHGTPEQAVVGVAGAGNYALAWLLGVGGASRTVLETRIPYGYLAMTDFLGGYAPEQTVSADTAKRMARSAWQRGTSLRETDAPIVGLGCTATIATDRTKRGDHRVFIATWNDTGVTTDAVILEKGLRERAGEEDVVSRLVIAALARACGVEAELDLRLAASERLLTETSSHGDPISRLLGGDARWVTVDPDGNMEVEGEPPAALLPGSFNPMHRGHTELAAAATQALGSTVAYELAVVNVDKPPLEAEEIRRRVEQFRGVGSVVLTRAETFHKKAKLFPGFRIRHRLGHRDPPYRTALLRKFRACHAYCVGRDVGIGLPVCRWGQKRRRRHLPHAERRWNSRGFSAVVREHPRKRVPGRRVIYGAA